MSENKFSYLCFGKLPAFGDFIRYNAGGKEIQAFDQWIQEGLLFAKNRLHPNWDLAYKKAASYCFVFPPRDNQQSLVGVFQSSGDKIGRAFPFIVGISIDKAFFASKYIHLIPVFFNPFMEKASSLMGELSSLQLPQSIPEKVESLSAEAFHSLDYSLDAYNIFKHQTFVTQYIDRMWLILDSTQKILLFEKIIEQLKSLQNYDLNRLNYGLRLPIGSDQQFRAFDATFWLEILGKLFPQYSSIPVLFYTANNPANRYYLYIFFSYPSPRNYVNFIQVDLEIDSIYKLDELKLANTPNSEQPGQKPSIQMVKENQSLHDFLEKLA